LGVFFKSIFTTLGCSILGGIGVSMIWRGTDFGYGLLLGAIASAFVDDLH